MIRPKIAIWSEAAWALGRIYKGAAETLSDDFDVTFFDWSSRDDNVKFFSAWDSFDVIMGNSSLSFSPIDTGFMKEIPRHILDKMILTIHTNIMNNSAFEEYIPDHAKTGPTWCGVTDEVGLLINDTLSVDNTPVMHNFTDIDVFSNIEHRGSIKTIGMIGWYPQNKDNHAWCNVKRPEMFIEIAEKAGVEYKFIFDFPIDAGKKMYEGLDLIVVPSVTESFSMPIIEAASCGIPVISTYMGVAQYLKNINTFETVDEAVYLIKKMNEDPEHLKEYTSKLQDEVRTNWNKKYIIDKYWRPIIKAKIK